MIVLNEFGIEHFKTQAWLFAVFLADKHLSATLSSSEICELSSKQKISRLPVKISTIYNEWSKSAGYKSFSDMKSHLNNATGKSAIYIEELLPTDLISKLIHDISPDYSLYSPALNQDYFLKKHSLIEKSHSFLCEYLYYTDQEMIISIEQQYLSDTELSTEYIAWTNGDYSAGIRSAIYLSGESIDELEIQAKSELCKVMKEYAEFI